MATGKKKLKKVRGRIKIIVEENLKAIDLPPLSDTTMSAIREVYDRYARPNMHQYW